MPQYLQILDFLLVFVLPGLLFLVWPRLNATVIIPILAAVVIGYLSSVYFNRISQDYYFHELEAKQARGEVLTPEEQGFDGVGDNVAAMFCGWLPAAIAIVLVLPIKLLVHWMLRRRRHNHALQLTADARGLR